MAFETSSGLEITDEIINSILHANHDLEIQGDFDEWQEDEVSDLVSAINASVKKRGRENVTSEYVEEEYFLIRSTREDEDDYSAWLEADEEYF